MMKIKKRELVVKMEKDKIKMNKIINNKKNKAKADHKVKKEIKNLNQNKK